MSAEMEAFHALELLSEAFPGEAWSLAPGEMFSPSKAKDGTYTSRLKQGRKAHPPEGGEPSPSKAGRLSYRVLLAATLQAIRNGNEDLEMSHRAEIMSGFRRTDSQINAALFTLLTRQEGGSTSATYGAVDTTDL